MKNKGKSMLAVAMTMCMIAGMVAFAPTKASATNASEIKVGDHVYFGINAAYDSKPILWRVVEIDTANNTATLLSEYILENRVYDTTHDDGTHQNWLGSDICTYLNGEFFNTSFNLAEQAVIAKYGTTDTTGEYVTSIDVSQKIVLPSVEGIISWLGSDTQRVASHVDSSKSDYDLFWWLRSPGIEDVYVAFVNANGLVNPAGINVLSDFGVRPALKLNLSSIIFTSEDPNSEDNKNKTYTVVMAGGADKLIVPPPVPNSGITVMFKDNKLNMILPIINVRGRTMYPFRECLEAMGAEVSWVAETKTAKGTLNGQTVEFIVGSGAYKVDGKQMQMDTGLTSFIKDGRTYIPIRYAAEGLGFDVEWNEGAQTINIK